jgi:hypothetical protein
MRTIIPGQLLRARNAQINILRSFYNSIHILVGLLGCASRVTQTWEQSRISFILHSPKALIDRESQWHQLGAVEEQSDYQQ